VLTSRSSIFRWWRGLHSAFTRNPASLSCRHTNSTLVRTTTTAREQHRHPIFCWINHGTNTMGREKARIPAWTDRILRKGTNLRQLSYNSAPLRFSDHRPVYATFECMVSIVDEKLRDKISREIYDRRKSEVGGETENLAVDETDDEDLIGYDAIEPGLPPASSDRQKWWLENGKMARSTIRPPKPESAMYTTMLNPKRPSNPYAAMDEPDWVTIPKTETRHSSFSSMSTSPFEQINHSMLLSTSASSSAPRKLPPPYDPLALPAKFGRLRTGEAASNTAQLDGPPPPPPPRRQVTVTNGSPLASTALLPRKPVSRPTPTSAPTPAPTPTPSVVPTGTNPATGQLAARPKGPPPVAKKPAHLMAPTSLANQGNIPKPQPPGLLRRSTGLQNSTSSHGDGHSLASRSGHADGEGEETPPRLPKGAASSTSMGRPSRSPAGAVGLVGLAQKPVMVRHKTPPPPPTPRKPQSDDLLGDDGAAEMGGWEALRPS